ncbi:MAG: response regulator transcription factor [Kofleriaceae bacterium]
MKILVVEDEARLATLLHRGLTEEGHQVSVASTAAAAAQLLANGPKGSDPPQRGWDVVVLDWGLPDGDGVTLLSKWRRHGIDIPVVMLTARGEVGERVTGLRTGADDYLVKPFDFEELLARLDSVVRRAGASAGLMRTGRLAIDARNRKLVFADRQVGLSGRELALATALLARVGDVLTRAELLAQVWGPEFDGPPNVVDVYIGYLRAKLRELDAGGTKIVTVRGLGYRLESP